MNNFTLMILCAGFGKRMLNLTRSKPKPLLKYKNKILLKNTIDFFTNIGCDEILINTHYLHNKIKKYLDKNFKNYPIQIIYEKKILGTGGGVKNIFNYTKRKKICSVNSDIFWTKENKLHIEHFLNNLQNISHCKMLLSKDINFLGLKKEIGDFNLKRNVVTNWESKNEKLYYSGLQIVSKNIFNNKKKIFPMNEIWVKLIKKNQIKGYVIPSKIRHIGDKKSFFEN
tara:strand:+ start:158 stop:838 length:681 start_codon:yes stop_codon:yes gene_type:complete